jgi:hypothetical protein
MMQVYPIKRTMPKPKLLSPCQSLYLDIYKANNLLFDPQRTLGIITPYRNQIALIRKKLEETGIAELSDIMIDT